MTVMRDHCKWIPATEVLIVLGLLSGAAHCLGSCSHSCLRLIHLRVKEAFWRREIGLCLLSSLSYNHEKSLPHLEKRETGNKVPSKKSYGDKRALLSLPPLLTCLW